MINSKSHRLIILSSVRRVEVSEEGEFYSFLTCVFKQYIYVYIFLYMFLFLFNLFLSYSLLSRFRFTYTFKNFIRRGRNLFLLDSYFSYVLFPTHLSFLYDILHIYMSITFNNRTVWRAERFPLFPPCSLIELTLPLRSSKLHAREYSLELAAFDGLEEKEK